MKTLNSPSSCSYKLIAEGKPLPQWHHLISKDKESVHKVNQSIQKYCVSENSLTKKIMKTISR